MCYEHSFSFKHLKNYVIILRLSIMKPHQYLIKYADMNKHWKIKFCAKHTGTVEIGCELSMFYSFRGKGYFNYCHEHKTN